VGIGHFVFHQVLAVHHDELGIAEVIEIALAVLQSVHPRVTGGLVAMPGVVGPDPTGLGFVVFYAPDMNIEECQ